MVRDIYSKRDKAAPGTLTYDALPEKLKIQIIHAWNNFFGQSALKSKVSPAIWKELNSVLREEHGKKELVKDDYFDRYTDLGEVQKYFEENTNVDESLDVVEFVAKFILASPKIYSNIETRILNVHYTPDQAVSDINARFLENAIGYQFQGGKIVRVDNNLLHQNIITPALQFLNSKTFKNANDEFLAAHEHFRHQRYKECLNDSLKSLETTMKIICTENSWQFNQNDTAKNLLDVCFKNNLIPSYLQNHYASLRAGLEGGVPTLRNKLSGHGQGANAITVPEHFASYMLYLAGTTINFFLSCQKVIKPFN